MENIGKTRTHVQALLAELNEIASREPEPKEFYFYLEHHARDLDCFGDLTNISSNELKRKMRFEDDDFVYASELPFLYTRKGITELAGAGTKVTAQIKCLTEKINLETLLMKEAEIKLVHPKRSHLSHTYRDIRLITDKEPQFPQAADWKKGEKFIKQWFNVVLQFYLPTQHRIVPVAVHNCWACFTKPQQANIVSWFKHYLSRHS